VTAHEVRVWPLRIEDVSYHASDLGVLHLPEHLRGRGAPSSALRIRLSLSAGDLAKMDLDELVFHLPGAGEKPVRLFEQIFARTVGVLVRDAEAIPRAQFSLTRDAIEQVGFDDSEALLPVDPRSFQGYRLLKEYACVPKRFFFFKVRGLAQHLRKIAGRGFEIVLLFGREDERLDGQVTGEDLALFCTPVINLFRFTQPSTIRLSERRVDYPIVPDGTRRIDYEVFSVQRVHAMGRGGRELQPFYAPGDSGEAGGAYYAIARKPRAMVDSESEQGRWRSDEYHGCDTFISIVDQSGTPTMREFDALDLGLMVTNRDLPLHLGEEEFRSWDGAVPLKSIRFVGPVRPPLPALAGESGAWALISHLKLNYLSLIERREEGSGAGPLQELLRLYAPIPEGARHDTLRDDAWSDQIRGIQRVTTKPITRRVPVPGPIAFARGLEIAIEVDEGRFDASGAMLLGSVLERFLARYASINTVVETVIRTANREIMRWPTRQGMIDIL